MVSVYLAGPIAHQSYEQATGWRDWATEELVYRGFDVYTPMRASRAELEDYEMMPLEEDKHTFQRDMLDITRADIVLVNWLGAQNVSIGTAFEMGAAHVAGKFVITVIEHASEITYPLANDGRYHPFIEGGSNVIVHSLEQAIDFIESTNPVRPPRVNLFPIDMVPTMEFEAEEEWEETEFSQAEYFEGGGLTQELHDMEQDDS